jgi:hypothetical protein
LNKVLYFSDFESYRRLGHPITGAEYQRNIHGPTARLFIPLVNQLAERGFAKIEHRMVGDYEQDIVRSLVEPNVNQFSPEELSIVDEWIEILRPQTGTEASDLTHERSAGWRLKRELGETIPYSMALIDPERGDEEAEAFLKRLEGIPA